MKAFFATVAGEFTVIHHTEKTDHNEIRQDIVSTMYMPGSNVMANVVLIELIAVTNSDSTFMIAIDYDCNVGVRGKW